MNSPSLRPQVCLSRVCGDRVETLDCGDEAALWLSRFLGQSCRLIRLSPRSARDARKPRLGSAPSPFSPLSLVNEAQYLMINLASVEQLQEIIQRKEEINISSFVLDLQNIVSRFRANLVIRGAVAFEEDAWSSLRIGDGARLAVSGKCSRCYMVGIDQDSAVRTKEPLLSLSELRRNNKVTFGVYLTHELEQDSEETTFLCTGSRIQPHTETKLIN